MTNHDPNLYNVVVEVIQTKLQFDLSYIIFILFPDSNRQISHRQCICAGVSFICCRSLKG